MRPKYIFAWVAFWALLIAGSAEYFFAVGGPWRIQALRPYLLSGPSDAWSHNQLLIHDIKRQTKDGTSKGPRFILLGGSASLEAITSDDDVLIQLKQNGISPVQFDSLASSLKTMGDETKILHALKDIPATILIPVEILQFTKTATAQLNATTEYRVIRKYGGLATPARSIEIITRHGGALAWDESLSLFRGSMALGIVFEVLFHGPPRASLGSIMIDARSAKCSPPMKRSFNEIGRGCQNHSSSTRAFQR
jgi:hypothetical protein